MICGMILLGIVLININPWHSRLWTNRLGQGEVPEMLLAEGKQNLCIRSVLLKTQLEIVENTSRKTIPHFIPSREPGRLLLKQVLLVADFLLFAFSPKTGWRRKRKQCC